MPLYRAYRVWELVKNSPAKRDKIILIDFISGFVIVLGLFLVLFFHFRGATEYIILHYNIYFGIDSLAGWQSILLLPLLGLVILILNLILSFYFYLRQRLLSYFLAFAALLFCLLLLLASGLLIYINL